MADAITPVRTSTEIRWRSLRDSVGRICVGIAGFPVMRLNAYRGITQDGVASRAYFFLVPPGTYFIRRFSPTV